jgi:hypothetical protein
MRTALAVLVILVLAASSGLAMGSGVVASVDRIASDQLLIDVSFDQSQFRFSAVDGYDYVYADGMAYLPTQGLPGLPMKQIQVAIPYRSSAVAVEVVRADEVALPGVFNIVPTQPPRILGQDAGAWVPGRQAVYISDQAYPAARVGGIHQGFMGDTRLLSFFVSPLRWNPATGALTLATSLDIVVRLDAGTAVRGLRTRPGKAREFTDAVRRSVANPVDVAAFADDFGPALLAMSSLEQGEYQYVIITVDSLAASFQPLVDWKTEKGVPAKLVTREWIEATYTGANVQEQIRSFIADAYQTWGTVWVLLGGDTEQIPSRQVYAMNCEMGPEGNKIRCDLYYSDLDGTWNANGVTPYGEVADSVDMYPDVIVGRAPAETVEEAEVFVEKVLTYEKYPPTDYALDMLFAGEVLWTNPLTDAGVGLDMIDDQCVPPRFDPILKLYETMGNESPEAVLAAMSAGQNIVLHDGHCNEYVMGMGDGYIWREDADTLSNSPRNFILNSIGCWPAAIDRDCIAERFINNPGGGCVAFIGNSRYGWGSPGNPGFGYSDRFQREFARVLLAEDIVNLGLANAQSKAYFAPYAQDENVFRWNEYQVNLLGDPEMPVWTDEPRAVTVDAPGSVMSPSGEARIVVADAWGGVEDALVCLTNGSDVYLVGRTDLSGTVAFEVTTASADSLLLTVTATNHIPYQARIEVISQGRLLALADYNIVDGGDGMPNPGETVDIEVMVENSGSQSASEVWGVLRPIAGLVQVTDSTVYFGSVGAQSTSWGQSHFTVTYDSSFANAQVVGFYLVLSDSAGGEWTSVVPTVVATPVFSVISYAMHDLLGDGDWIAEPGETVMVTLEVANQGLTAGEATVSASTGDGYLSVEDSVTSTGSIDAGGIGHSLHRLVISPACPATYVGRLEISLTAPADLAFDDTVYFNVGDLAFSDDCESGEGIWTRSGSPDLWHISTYRAHSGSSSWYFGDDGTHTYVSSANSSITSADFIAGEDSKLSFWFWYDFTTYGVDGLYVVVTTNGVPDTLDYIGSGGALNIMSRWVPWEQVLDVTPGDTLTVAFGFKSDGTDIAEGMYLDDIALASKEPGQAGVPGGGGREPDIAFSAYPNPAADRLVFYLSGIDGQAVMDIYDIQGRCVATLVKPVGTNSVTWDVRSADRRVAPGIYLATVRQAGYNLSRKVVVLR